MERLSYAAPGHTSQGILIILASVIAMSFSDAIVKLVSAELTVWQVFVARSIFALPCLMAVAFIAKSKPIPLSLRWIMVRSGLLVLTWLAYYAALPFLDFSVAAVAIYTNPIFTALMTAALLKKRVSGRQWVGVLLGFLGVAVILKPGSEAFSWFILLPLLGAASYSAAMILTHSKCQQENPITLALALHISFIGTGLIATLAISNFPFSMEAKAIYPFLLGDWASMETSEWGLMAFLGILSAAFFLGVARAYQIAPPQIIATFDYGYLVAAAVWGFVFFSEEPDLLTVAGMILITLAGILATSRSSGRASTSELMND